MQLNGELFQLLANAQRRAFANMENTPVGTSDITATQAWLLIVIRAHRNSPVTEIAHKLGIHASAATRLVQRLEIKGYIKRKRCTTDHRLVALDLSDTGEQACNEAELQINEAEANLLRNLDTPDTARLKDMLRRLLAYRTSL